MTPQDFFYLMAGIAFIFLTGLITVALMLAMFEANKPRDDQTYRKYLEDLMHKDED